MKRLLHRRARTRGRTGSLPAPRAMLHAGIVAVHAVLVPYHLLTEVHLFGGSPSSGHADSSHIHHDLGAHDHGHDRNHTPHAAADHDREGTRPEGSDRAVAAAGDAVLPREGVVPASADWARLADPGPLLAHEGTRLGPRRIRGPPPAPTPIPS